jgi:hypothetical protein
MSTNFRILTAKAILALTSATAGGAVIPHSKTIVVESPGDLLALAQANAEAIYLHNTNDGGTVLYIEAQNGQQLTALDVTDPSRIQRVAQTTIPANSAFDFVKSVGNNGAIIRYRDGSGVAFLSLKNSRHPVLVKCSALQNMGTSEAVGQTALLVTANEGTMHPFNDPQNYKVVDTSDQSQPTLLATIPAVMQQLGKSDTGTIFLLNRDGVTIVRRLRVEEEHQIQLDQVMDN